MNTKFLLSIIRFWKKRKSSVQVNDVRFEFTLLDLRGFVDLEDAKVNNPSKSLEDMKKLNNNMDELRKNVEIAEERCTKKERAGKKKVHVWFRVWYDKKEDRKKTAVGIRRWSVWRRRMCPQEGSWACKLGEGFLKQIPGELTKTEKASGSKL